MQPKRQKIRQLYGEIDRLDERLGKARTKSERTGIKQRLLVLREEVAILLQPDQTEGSSLSARATQGQPNTVNVGRSAASMPLGLEKVVGSSPSGLSSAELTLKPRSNKPVARYQNSPTKDGTKKSTKSKKAKKRQTKQKRIVSRKAKSVSESESPEQRKARQERNAAYFKNFRSSNPAGTGPIPEVRKKERRYWWNEE